MKKKSLLFCLLTLLMFNFSNVFANNKVTHKVYDIFEYERMKPVLSKTSFSKSMTVCMEPNNFTADIYDCAYHVCVGMCVCYPQCREFVENKLGTKHEVVTRYKQIIGSRK